MKRIKVLFLVLFYINLLFSKSVVVELDGPVDNGMAYLLNRAISKVSDKDTLILKINTYGGLLLNPLDKSGQRITYIE